MLNVVSFLRPFLIVVTLLTKNLENSFANSLLDVKDGRIVSVFPISDFDSLKSCLLSLPHSSIFWEK